MASDYGRDNTGLPELLDEHCISTYLTNSVGETAETGITPEEALQNPLKMPIEEPAARIPVKVFNGVPMKDAPLTN